MPLGEGVAKFVRVRDGAVVPPQKDIVPGEDRAMQQKRGEPPFRKAQSDVQERGRKQQQSQPNQQTQDLQPFDRGYNSNGFYKTHQSTVDARRLEIADEARVKPPVTRLGSNPTMISKGDRNGQSRSIPPIPPPQTVETLQSTKEPTYEYDDGRRFYETDAENLDNTTIFSDETQSRDDERKLQGTYYHPPGLPDDRETSNPDMQRIDAVDERYRQAYRVNRDNGSCYERDSAGDEGDEDTEDGRSSEEGSEEVGVGDDATRNGSSHDIQLSAHDVVSLQMEAATAKSHSRSMAISQISQQPFTDRVIPLTNQQTNRHGLTSPYPSTASSEAHEYALNPQVRIGTPPQSQIAVSRHPPRHDSATRSNQPPKERRAGKPKLTRKKSVDQQDLQYQDQQTQADQPPQISTHVRHESPVQPSQPQKQEQFTHPIYDQTEVVEEDITADPIDEVFSARSNSNLQDPSTPKQKPPLELDYDSDQLSKMTYVDLKNEPFDHDPRAPTDILPEPLVSASLAHRLGYITDQAKRHDVPIEQLRVFFSSLPIAEFEECGDLIVEQFAAIIGKFKEARKEKRKVAMEFEGEVSKREEGIRGKREAIGKDMGRLRKAGEDVIKGKGA